MSSPPSYGLLDWVLGKGNVGMLNREDKATTDAACHLCGVQYCCKQHAIAGDPEERTATPRACHFCKDTIGEGSAIFMFNDLPFCSQRHRYQAAELKERQDAFRGHEISPAPRASPTDGRHRWI